MNLQASQEKIATRRWEHPFSLCSQGRGLLRKLLLELALAQKVNQCGHFHNAASTVQIFIIIPGYYCFCVLVCLTPVHPSNNHWKATLSKLSSIKHKWRLAYQCFYLFCPTGIELEQLWRLSIKQRLPTKKRLHISKQILIKCLMKISFKKISGDMSWLNNGKQNIFYELITISLMVVKQVHNGGNLNIDLSNIHHRPIFLCLGFCSWAEERHLEKNSGIRQYHFDLICMTVLLPESSVLTSKRTLFM